MHSGQACAAASQRKRKEEEEQVGGESREEKLGLEPWRFESVGSNAFHDNFLI